MSTAHHISQHYAAEFEVTAEDGFIRLPAEYSDLANARLRVIVLSPTPIQAVAADSQRDAQQAELVAAFEELARVNPYRHIADPVAWQREQRQDRALPGRD